jgi:hypothetical protein
MDGSGRADTNGGLDDCAVAKLAKKRRKILLAFAVLGRFNYLCAKTP